jgi:hypothetical protein
MTHARGTFSFLGTNTISQGDTGRTAITFLLENGVSLYRADSSRTWPGDAAVFVAVLHFSKSHWNGIFTLDGSAVEAIDTRLQATDSIKEPYVLSANSHLSYKGFDLGGLGFTFTLEEYETFIEKHPEETEVIHPYINGHDLYTSPNQEASRYAINFLDMSLEEATRYPACLERVRGLVKPQRDQVKRKRNQER